MYQSAPWIGIYSSQEQKKNALYLLPPDAEYQFQKRKRYLQEFCQGEMKRGKVIRKKGNFKKNF